MGGFGQTVEQQKLAAKEAGADAAAAAAPVTSEDIFASLQKEANILREVRPRSHQFIGIGGHEGTSKTGIVFDAYAKDPQRVEQDQLWVLDYDSGSMMLHDAHYGEDRSVVNWDPWVMQIGERTANDYPGTHKRTLDICKYAVHIAEKQLNPEYEGERVWGLLVCGIDLWDQVCINNMRITDLGLAKDGIDAADNRGSGQGERVGHQWDWAMRKTRFHQLTAICRRLVKLGVRVFWETHLRKTNYSFGDSEKNAKWRPDWEKATNNYIPTILICERNDEYDEDGNVTRSEYVVTFEKCKTNAELQGQRRTTFITKAGEKPEWRGLPELYDGSL